MAGGGGADSMLQFQLERGRNRMKRYRNMKRRQRARLVFVGRKHDTALQRRPEERQHQGDEREETTLVGLTQILLGQKIKKTYMVDSASINGL
jgi:hypothetical protein